MTNTYYLHFLLLYFKKLRTDTTFCKRDKTTKKILDQLKTGSSLKNILDYRNKWIYYVARLRETDAYINGRLGQETKEAR
jgi:tartrate dehydratase beta subunit/fumarate hydratase class I family protein